MASGKQLVEWGGVVVTIRPRRDDRWVIYWREAGKGRQTTALNEKEARIQALAKAKTLSAGIGGKVMTLQDAHLVERLKAIAGERSPLLFLDEIEDAQKRLGQATIAQAATHFLATGMKDIVRVSVSEAKTRFLALYANRSKATHRAHKTELEAFCAAHQMDVCDIERDLLESWIERKTPDGKAPHQKTVITRHGLWVTFLNRCQEWNWLAKGEHAGKQIEKRQEPRLAVHIWTPDVARAALEAARKYLPKQSLYLAIACWLGLRPSEVTRLRWELFDWKSGYIHLDISVCRKLQEERFVPLNPTARALIQQWLQARGLWEQALAGKLKGKCCRNRDRVEISLLLRKKKVIDELKPDVMRHSYISYMIALGHSKHEVAEWAGNSEAIIRKRYRRPLRKEDGEAWASVGLKKDVNSSPPV